MFAHNVSIHLKPSCCVAASVSASLVQRRKAGRVPEPPLLTSKVYQGKAVQMFTRTHERKIAIAKQTTRLAHELPAMSSKIHLTREDIAELAYAQWQEEGCPEGTHEVHWLRAEQDLIANREFVVQGPRT